MAFITGAVRGRRRANAVRLAAEGVVDKCGPVVQTGYPSPVPDDVDETPQLVALRIRTLVYQATFLAFAFLVSWGSAEPNPTKA